MSPADDMCQGLILLAFALPEDEMQTYRVLTYPFPSAQLLVPVASIIARCRRGIGNNALH